MNNSSSEITRALTAAVDAFCGWIAVLPTEPPNIRDWGSRETLAHLVFHHEIYAQQVEALVNGVKAPLPRGTFNDLNAAAAARLGGEPPAQMISRLQAANSKLCKLYDMHDLAECSIQVKKGSIPWKLKNLLPAVESHIRCHLKQLEKDLHQTHSP